MNARMILMVVSGSVRLSIETDSEVKEYYLNNRCTAIVVPEASWIKAFDFSSGAVLVGFSDKKYKDCEYIDNYNTFKELIRAK